MKAMILAAGKGTRLRPLTDTRPKALVEIQGRTLLELVVERLKKAGVREIIINVHHHAEQIIEFVKKKNAFGLHVAFSVEDELLDTGGGLKKARWFFDDVEMFLLHNVDILTDLNYDRLFKALQTTGALAALAVRRRRTSRYLLFNAQKRLVGWQNVRSGELKIARKTCASFSPLAFSGIHALRREIFDYFPDEPAFSIIDAYLQIAHKAMPVVGVSIDDCRWLDVGKPEELEKAQTLFSDFF